MRHWPRFIMAVAAAAAINTALLAQGGRPASPTGSSAADIGGRVESTYKAGKWIEITYGRPIKRGRDVFGGSGADYGKLVNPDSPVWRAGANASTQLTTELPIVIGGTTIAPGTYTVFIDLKPDDWTLIVSSWKAQTTYDPDNKAELWGSYGYTPDKDVARATMTLATLPHSHEQLSWEFFDVSDTGGTLALMWDRTMASVPFTVAPR